MRAPTSVEYPYVETAYESEFGFLDPHVGRVAGQIWATSGSILAEELLRDTALGLQLMIKAAARVSNVLAANPSAIRSRRAYVYRTFKNLVLNELEKENGRRQILEREFRPDTVLLPESELNLRILINEIRRQMSGWTRRVFDLHQIGYTFEEIAESLDMPSNLVRSKYSKEVARLARKINAEIKDIDSLMSEPARVQMS